MAYSDKGKEPKLIFPALGPFYERIGIFSYPLVRVTVGGVLLTHGWLKLMGGAQAFATSSMARRGIEPALLWAYVIIFMETVGALCIMTGLFTRVIAAGLVIEFAVIMQQQWPRGYTWSGGGWEYPLLWGLIFLAIALRGGGPYSLDRKLGKEI